jgi:hypothetical protein
MIMWLTNSVTNTLLYGYRVVDRIRESLDDSIRRQSLVKEFRLDELPQLSAKFDKLLTLLLVPITYILVIS